MLMHSISNSVFSELHLPEQLSHAKHLCTRRWGFCDIFEHFFASSFSCSQAESTPAPAPVTQTVGRQTFTAISDNSLKGVVELEHILKEHQEVLVLY